MSGPDDHNLTQNNSLNDRKDNLKYWYSTAPIVIKNEGQDGTNNCVKAENVTNIAQRVNCSGTNIGKLFVSAGMKLEGGNTGGVRFIFISSEGTKHTDVHITNEWKTYCFTTPYLVDRSEFILSIYVWGSSQNCSLNMKMIPADDYNLIQNKLFNDGRNKLKHWFWNTSVAPVVVENGGWDGTNNCVTIASNSEISQEIKCDRPPSIKHLFLSVNMKVSGATSATVFFTTYISADIETYVDVTDQWQNYYFHDVDFIDLSHFALNISLYHPTPGTVLHLEKLYID